MLQLQLMDWTDWGDLARSHGLWAIIGHLTSARAGSLAFWMNSPACMMHSIKLRAWSAVLVVWTYYGDLQSYMHAPLKKIPPCADWIRETTVLCAWMGGASI